MAKRVVLLTVLLCTCSLPAAAANLVPASATWRFLRGTAEASQPDTTRWRTNDFNDTNFADAPAPFWYGDVRPGGTQLPEMLNNYTCIFLRREFTAANVGATVALQLDYFIDDGFVAWINGVEVFRVNVPAGEVTRATLATNQPADPAPWESVRFPVPAGLLREGANLLAVQAFNTSAGSSDFGFDCALTSLEDDATPPTILSVTPPPGDLNALTQITVTFSEPVTGVNADDLFINSQPASGVTGSGATYTFTFGQPLYGHVAITWFADHGIQDQAFVPNPFDATAPDATWSYALIDDIHPEVASVFPAPGTTVRALGQIEVTFSEEVNGVEAEDLLINGQPATSVSRLGGGPYRFQFPTPTPGTVQVRWRDGHGIADQATAPNPFAGGSWTYTYDPDAPAGDLVITEILASNQNGLVDEDGEPQDWIEIHNRGAGPVDLVNWSLSDDPEIPGLWTFPRRTLAAGAYLVVFASGKDRKPTSASGRLHTNFKLGRGPDHIGLYTADSPRALASGFESYPEQRNDHSYGFDSGGNLRYFATPTPGAPNGASSIVGVVAPVHFSVSRGFFSNAFTLTLSTPTPGARILYTTDGSEPTMTAGNPFVQSLRITNTTLLRAAAFKNNFLPSTVGTHSYLFHLTPSQRTLPILNLVTATNNLIGRHGIVGMGGGSRASDNLFITNNPATDYHNPSAHGIAWERPVSVEYIVPEDNSGFQIDAGLRVQGSDYQRPRLLPSSKFSFRLYFRGEYGQGTLEYPLFPLSPVDTFDQLVLRAGFNEQANPFIRDEITRRLSHDMGQVASHGSLWLVLLNGAVYTNNPALTPVYNPCERVHEEMLRAHLGGGEEWDVVAPTFATSASGLGVVDGDRNEFNNFMTYIWNQQNSNTILNPAVYREVGRRLDLVNFVDYCLLNAYVAMGDWPANNWRAGRERSTNGIWRFIVWDAEWAMGIYSLSVNRDSFAFSGTGTEDAGLNSTVNSEIARIYQRLRPNPEFRLLWADRIHKHFFNNGALTGLNITNRFNELRDQLRGFIPAMDTEILQWARDRHNIVMAQFNTYGLYGYSNALYGIFASSNAPAFNRHGGRVAPGFTLTMTSPLGGTIYYTLNGDDPRVPFTGAVSNSATAYAGPVTLAGSVTVKARSLLNGTNWSALAEARFEVGSLGVPLRITEIMYNPPGGSLYEFIELQNIGAAPVTLSGMTLSDEVSYVFPVGASLAAGARLVLANATDPTQFATRYGAGVAFGYFNGNLNNAGGRIVLSDAEGRVIQTVDYNDENGWPRAADGSGYSLEIINPDGSPDDPANWRASATLNGSPGAPNPPPPAPAVALNEVLANNVAAVNHAGTFPDWVELHNPGAEVVDLTGWSLSDDGNARKFVFPAATTIAAGGYLVVWCDAATNTTPGLHAGFSLERSGESLFLYNAQTNLVDAMTLGLQITDYSVGRVVGAWSLNTPTPGAPNSAAALAPASSLALNEWLANPVPGQPDWVELFNRSLTLPVALQGIYLGTTGTVERLPALSFIAPGGYVQLFADEGVGPDRLGFRLPAVGGGIVLYDETAVELERVTYSAQSSGVSQGRLPDGAANIVSFPGSASPAAMNYTSTYTGPVLNEVLARNGSVLVAGAVVEFVELHNAGAAPFDLGGMSLSVNEASPGAWRFAPGTLVPAGGYLVVPCDGSRPAATNAGGLNLGEPLDGESGGVYLFNAAGQLVNSVEYGFQIEDRPIGLSGGQWRLLTAATPGAANAAAETLGTNSALRVNEWMAAPAAGADWFELYNSTNRPVDLGTISLTDHPSLAERGEFRVAPLSFIAGGGFVKWVADGNAGQGRNHVNFALDGAGDSVLVYGVSGTNFTLIDGVGFGPQALDVSVGRLPDGAGEFSAFPGSPTPAESNYRLIDNVVISEVLTHTDPPLEDSIELRNPTASPVSVGGWYLSNSRDNYRKYRIPDGTTIPAGGHIVILERHFNDGSANGFGLSSARGDEVWLSATDMLGNLTGDRTAARFGAAFNGVSFNRVQTSVGVDYAPASQRTLGSVNAAPRVGPVVINEIHYHPAGLMVGDEEYVELHNEGPAPVALHDPAHPENRWKIDGGIRFGFPGGLTLAAGGYLLVVRFDPAVETARLAAFRARHGLDESVVVLGPFLGRLGDQEDSVELYQPDTPQGPGTPDAGLVPYVLVDRVSYTDATPWPAGAVDGGGLSLQRRGPGLYGNEPLHWLAATPTPAAANGGGTPAPPTITTSPQDQTVPGDATAMFAVQASGGGPLSYQWRFNGAPLPDATNAVLVIAYAQLENTGSYDVIVSNPGGADLSAPATLTVNAPAVVLLPPASPVIAGGGSANLTVQAMGTAPLQYEWWRNGEFIPSVTGPTFPISNARFIDGGEYVVRVSNAFGSMSTNAYLTVLIDPTIVVQPVAQFGPRGSSVVLSVMVTNEATWPISYRWRRNGASVATNFLYSHVSFFTVTNIQGSNQWTVVVTNRSRPAGFLSTGAAVVALDDTDGDGIPDRDETTLGLNPNDPADGAADADGDGLTNAEEHLAGTNHSDPESYLKVDRIAHQGSAVLSFTAVSGRTYSVLFKDSLAATEWSSLANIPARTTTRTETVTDTRPPATRFYRLVTPGRE